jgi:hypothetical protein
LKLSNKVRGFWCEFRHGDSNWSGFVRHAPGGVIPRISPASAVILGPSTLLAYFVYADYACGLEQFTKVQSIDAVIAILVASQSFVSIGESQTRF